MHACQLRRLVILAAVAWTGRASGMDWPRNYIVAEHSESPDGRFGILVESKQAVVDRDSDSNDGEANFINYLADLRAHQVLGKIEGSDYFEHQNHRDLIVKWSSDSKLCVAAYWGRYGFDSIKVLEPREHDLVQVEIGDRVQKASNAATKRDNREDGVDIAPYFRIGPNGKIRVLATGQNNPKQFPEVKTYYTLFHGTYDYPRRKWIEANARTISSELDEHLQSALADPDRRIFVGSNPPADFEGSLVSSEEEKATLLDQTLNDVYQADRLLLTPVQFARVKAEEKEWLVRVQSAPSAAAKSELIADRIKTLQDLLWQ